MSTQNQLLSNNWKKNFPKVSSNLTLDPFFKDPSKDTRLSLSLILRIPTEISRHVLTIQQNFQKDFPKHYYYPPKNLHCTVIGLINIQENFKLDTELFTKIDLCLKEICCKINHFKLTLKGINISPSSLFVPVYYKNDLDLIRRKIIQTFQEHHIFLDYRHLESFDVGYGWVTIMRFKEENNEEFLDKIEPWRQHLFGEFDCKSFDLVITNKCLTTKQTTVVKTYNLACPT